MTSQSLPVFCFSLAQFCICRPPEVKFHVFGRLKYCFLINTLCRSYQAHKKISVICTLKLHAKGKKSKKSKQWFEDTSGKQRKAERHEGNLTDVLSTVNVRRSKYSLNISIAPERLQKWLQYVSAPLNYVITTLRIFPFDLRNSAKTKERTSNRFSESNRVMKRGVSNSRVFARNKIFDNGKILKKCRTTHSVYTSKALVERFHLLLN